MPDTLVQVGEGHANVLCANCATIQLNEFRLYYNDTTGALTVEQECVCSTEGGGKYKETSTVTLSAS